MVPMTGLQDRIYEAVFFPELWEHVLHDMSIAVKAEGAVLANLSSDKNPWIASEGVSALYDAFFTQGWGYDNAKTKLLLATPHQGFISDADHRSDAWMAEQPVYRDLYWKFGFGYAAATIVDAPTGDTFAISIEKKKTLGPVDRQGIDFLDSLRPHLARAATFASRLAFARVEGVLDALNMTDLPAAMIRDDGSVIGCNPLLDSLSSQVTIQGRDRLNFHHKAAAAFFETVLARHRCREAGEKRQSCSFPVPASEDGAPAIIHVVPITGAARDIFVGSAFLVVVTRVERQEVPSVAVIKGLFDLTPAEARVGRSLAGGTSVKGAASEFGLSVETVRSHVKAILAKSGMTRQSDFVAAVSRLRPFSSE